VRYQVATDSKLQESFAMHKKHNYLSSTVEQEEKKNIAQLISNEEKKLSQVE
jgi:hypothetical protein